MCKENFFFFFPQRKLFHKRPNTRARGAGQRSDQPYEPMIIGMSGYSRGGEEEEESTEKTTQSSIQVLMNAVGSKYLHALNKCWAHAYFNQFLNLTGYFFPQDPLFIFVKVLSLVQFPPFIYIFSYFCVCLLAKHAVKRPMFLME